MGNNKKKIAFEHQGMAKTKTVNVEAEEVLFLGGQKAENLSLGRLSPEIRLQTIYKQVRLSNGTSEIY